MAKREDWIWYLVVDENGNVDEAFNSPEGAEEYQEVWGGIIIPVKEKNDERISKSTA